MKLGKWGYEVNTSSDLCISSINSFYHQEFATSYEKAVFDAVNCLVSPNRDDYVAYELHLKALWYIEWHLDLLTLWALAYTGELAKVEDLHNGLRAKVSKMNLKKQESMQKGLLLAEALFNFAKGDFTQALELLGLEFDADDCKAIGASGEQIDVCNEVWYTMLLDSRHASKATKAIEKQIKKRDGAPFLWQLLERAYSMLGKQEAAASARAKADTLEGSYFG